MLNISIVKMGKYFGDSYIRYDGEVIESDPECEEEMFEYYDSLLEIGDGIWTSLSESSMDPTETAKESVSSHQAVKTVKKTNKKKSMEQRARNKRTYRIDLIPEIECE